MSDPEGNFVVVGDMLIQYSPPCQAFSTARTSGVVEPAAAAMSTNNRKNESDEDDDVLTTTEFSPSYQYGLITTGIVPKKMNINSTAVYTAVIMDHEGEQQRPNKQTSEKSTQTTTTVSNSSADDDKNFLTSFNRCSLLLGFLVGCFIQSSSLGANYILTIFFGHDRQVIQDNRSHIYLFSLVWSFLTSMMGVLILFFLRSLLVVHNQNAKRSSNKKNNSNKEMNALFVHLEYSFAFGALAGVCVAWTFTDLLLGLNVHAYHSILTLVFAIIGKVIVEYTSCCQETDTGDDVDVDENSLAEPLLLDQEQASPTAKAPTQVQSESMHGEFKFKGICIGLLVGFFIQFSSLGASFLLDALYGGENHNNSHVITKKELLSFSLAWSFLFGTMGVMILLLLRELVLMVWQQQQQQQKQQQQTKKATTVVVVEWMERLCLDLEFYFAVGCLLGVNIAWVLTDLGLGFKAHIIRSLLTLFAAAVWCKVLAYCFAYNLRNNNAASSTSSTRRDEEEEVPLKALLIV